MQMNLLASKKLIGSLYLGKSLELIHLILNLKFDSALQLILPQN